MTSKRDRWSAEGASKLVSAAIFLIAGAAIISAVNWNDRRIALHEAADKATLLLNRNLATHQYFSSVLKPSLLDQAASVQDPNGFDPRWMSSSYAVREIAARFAALSPDRYYYKDAAINARSPENEADDFERAFLVAAAKAEGPSKWSGVRIVDGKHWFVTMQRGETMDRSCLRCHDTPARAPRGLVESYGSLRSFGRHEGELASIVSIRVPLEEAYASANTFSLRLSAGLALVLGAIFIATTFVNRRLVFGPLARLRRHSELVAGGEREVGERIPLPRGSDLQGLTDAFNAMSAQIHAQKADLERQVVERTHEVLRTESRYQHLFDDNPLPMWVYDSESLAILAVNGAAIEHYGYSREQFLAMTIQDIRPPGDIPRLWLVRTGLGPSRSRSGIFRHVKASGEIIEVEIISHETQFLNRRCRIVLANDVTERLQAERALRVSEEQYRVVTDGVPLRIAYIDAERRYRFVNRAYVEFLRRNRDTIIGRTMQEVMGESVYGRLAEHVEAALRGERGTFERSFELSERAGRPPKNVYVRFNYVPRADDQGSIVGFFSIAEDVTERRELEERFRQAQKMEAVGRLAGGVAHDFNNITTVIKSFGGFLLEEIPASDPKHSDAQEIVHAAERAASLTRQLLAFSRNSVTEPKIVHLNDIVSSMEKMMRRIVGEDIDIQVRLDPCLQPVKMDVAHIEQVLTNLVVNARDAMPRGGRLAIETLNVEFPADASDHRLEVTPGPHVALVVSDNGEGMTKATQDHIFEPFFTTKKERGSGLGLATVYGIVKQARGFIAVHSEPGRGTSFRICFPRAETRIARNTPRKLQAVMPTSGDDRVVLLVEDETALRHATRRILEKHGFKVLPAANGDEAVALMAERKHRFDVVLTDVVMPGRSGTEVVRVLRELHPGIPAVFMSGYPEGRIEQERIHGEDAPFVAKPFSAEELIGKLRGALRMNA